MVWETKSGQETMEIGCQIGKKAKPGEIYCLCGDLGAGKTEFAKGFAQGLGIEDMVNSPTFTIVQEYFGAVSLYHFDVYRIAEEEELYDIGYEEYFFGNGVCLIEWADLIKGLIPPDAVWITLERDLARGDNVRRICLTGGGK